MPAFDFKKFLPHIIIIAGFLLLSVIYALPALEGKKLAQGDIKNWTAMTHEAKSWHEKTGENTLWSNSMFGGMPTYTSYVPENANYFSRFQNAVESSLPAPANYLFLAMLCFYVLMCVLGVNRWLGIAGAIAFAFSTYNITFIVAGHNSKVITMIYMPLVLAGMLMTYRGKYFSGGILFTVAFAFLINASHIQIIFYLGLICVLAVIGMLIKAIREKNLKTFFIASVISAAGILIGILPGITNLLTVNEYSKATMRGGTSELTFNHDTNKKQGGLDKDYAFQWSAGVGETFCILVPDLYGGSTKSIDEAPKAGEFMARSGYDFVPTYWGPQPFLGGPAYFGAIICFLFLLGMMVIRSRHKWWILAACILGFMMAWGDHFKAFNYLLFDHLPFYNKLRTPSTSFVIPEFLFPIVAIWGLWEFMKGDIPQEELMKKLKLSLGITAGLCLLLGLGGSLFLDFTDQVKDARYPADMLKALKEDRAAIAMKSGLISALYIILAGVLLWAFLKKKINNTVLITGVTVLIAIDLVSTAHSYLNERNYEDDAEAEVVFQPRLVDLQVMQDKDPYYRVMDITHDLYNDAMPAYFHKCIGGYSPAKLELYQDLIDVHMNPQKQRFTMPVLNMLNTKYLIFPAGQKGDPVVQQNAGACGNAWFVADVKWVSTADDEILSLNGDALGDTAHVANSFEPLKTAVIRDKYKSELEGFNIGKDSNAKVKLTQYGLNNLSFESSNSHNGLAVFSDIYYDKGWEAYIDGKETPIIKADYLLRALKVPAGNHKIEFHFRPKSYIMGSKIAAIGSFLLYALCIAGLVIVFRPGKKDNTPVV